MKNLITSFLILASCSILVGQKKKEYFWNTDFEYATPNQQPRKWAIEGEGGSYNTLIVNSEVKSGNYSLEQNLESAEVYMILSISKELIAGKHVEVSCYLKTKETDTLTQVFLFLDQSTGNPIVSNPNFVSSSNWQKVSFSHSFTDENKEGNLLIALQTSGSGTIWVDDFQLKIEGELYGIGSPDFREPTAKEINFLNQKACEISSLDVNTGNQELVAMGKMIGDAKVVALGENSHGSAPIYKMKLRIVKYLVEELGFSVFALESPAIEANYINKYVVQGEGTLEGVIKNLAYKSWQTQEMLEIIEWLKEYNESGKIKVEFRGFDMQNGFLAMKYLTEFAQQSDPVLLRKLDSIKVSINQNQQFLIPLLMNDLVRIVSSQKNEELVRYCTILTQSLAFNNQLGDYKSRDAYMADNIQSIQKNVRNGKVIVSADNDHIRTSEGKMGYYLEQLYNNNYYTIGFTFNKGSYAAIGEKSQYDVHPSYSGTYEYLFSKSTFNNFYLQLNATYDIPYLQEMQGFRTIGSRPQETSQFFEINLTSNFDIILFLENSEATSYLGK